jgi:hypothetical protein
MPKMSFNSTVSARTKCAIAILGDEQVLKKYIALGGLARDLEQIRDVGFTAEAANLAQANAKRAGAGATVDVLKRFAELQREYSAVMNVLLAVKGDLLVDGADPKLVNKVEHILVNEAELSVKTARDEAGNKKRTTRRSASQEAIRAEIEKDAGELAGFVDIHPALAARGVSEERVNNLRKAAADRTAMLADRVAKKGGAKTSTEDERAAVEKQALRWGTAYRLLAALAAENPSVAALLKEAAR